ncbi:HlyIII-domain-containing protein [Metschnikowia bicuspidata]|uniref:HlyIII-domain-containing protein n=1 Tax=Metschnikowia bicuspidata TaxID=27322 RepID=A0A4P9ZI91_9ASCO|nr:HlyIII-domain-containing protein [Metschnikowia bicuspidata]
MRNRFRYVAGRSGAKVKSTDELLVEKLDAFLSSIEQRLHSFETYFQLQDVDDSGDAAALKQQSLLRRPSVVLMLLMKEFSLSNLNMVYEQLTYVKDQMLKTSIQNLDFLYKTLDDKYNDLFNPDGEDTVKDDSKDDHHELLTEKIITTLHFFDVKLVQIDAFIKSKTPLATDAYEEGAKFKRFRFFNFNKALKTGQTEYLHYYQLPLSWRENRYIINGYRFSLTHMAMLKSILYFNHNETWNIWTHLLGGIAVTYLGLVHYPSTAAYSKSSFADNTIMALYILAALKCLVSSVLWHTYSTFARLAIRTRFACIDYTGITVLVTCSVISAEYCCLYNYPKLLAIFMGLSIVAGLAGFVFNWSNYFDHPDCRPLRIGFYVCLAALGFTSFLCKWYYDGFFYAFTFSAPLIWRSFVWYWVGVIFYGGLIPEKWRYDVMIHDEDTCNNSYSALDVLLGDIENAGEEKLRSVAIENKQKNDADSRSGSSDEVRYKDILEKHFPENPRLTPYHNDFLSLWWVDYVFQSHNLWHLFVVFGVVGHYFCLVEMFEQNHEMFGTVWSPTVPCMSAHIATEAVRKLALTFLLSPSAVETCHVKASKSM